MNTIEDDTIKLLSFFLALLAGGVAACGGEESVAGIDGRGSPNPVAVVAKGTITSFGSIVVNGVRYDTGNTTFGIDGRGGTLADLAVGHVVVVSGTLAANGTDGTADSVTFSDVVEGPIAAIDVAANTITVLGQIVRIDADTSFDDDILPASIDGLAIDDVVEVSGFLRADGSIAATRIETKLAGGEFEVTGTVQNLSGSQFEINALVVDFGAAQLDDFPNGAPENGQLVEAKGTAFGGSGEFIATRVEFKGNDLNASSGDQVEVEGFITRFVSADDFDVGGVAVTTTSATRFEGGTAADLGLNLKVEVEGSLDGNGMLVADEVDIRRARQVRATALVDSVDAGNDSLVLLGITFNVDSSTRIEDKSDADLRPFTLSDLNAGDYVEIRGDEFPADSGEVRTSRLEREDPDPDTILQGFVESISNPSYTVLGVTVETNGSTEFRDENDNAISMTEFFDRLDENDLVKAEGTETSATTIVAEEVEFESEF